jgi:hypothetical protein
LSIHFRQFVLASRVRDMANTYTLEEAAEKVNIPPDEFKRRLREDWKHIRSFRDGSTLRFRANDVDELARSLGLGSSTPELQLPEPGSAASSEVTIPMELNLDDSGPAPVLNETPSEQPKSAPTEEVENLIVLDDNITLGGPDVFVLQEDKPAPAPPSGSKLGLKKPDSDVRLEKAEERKSKKKPDDSSDSILTEEIDLGVMAGGSSGKLTGSSKIKLSPSSSSSKISKGGSGKIKKSEIDKTTVPPPDEEDSSEFELSLDVDSSDEFELSLSDDSSADISLGDVQGAPSAGPRSGINLSNPVDSGLSLEERGTGPKSGTKSGGPKSGGPKSGKSKSAPKPADDEEEIDFELSLDTPGASSKGLGSSKSSKKLADSDSEFELTLDSEGDLSDSLEVETGSFASDEQKGDIFETDFEIPALDDDSASEAVALEEADTDLDSSDFDLAVDETGLEESASEVVAIDDETEAPKPKPKGKKKAPKPAREEEVVEADDQAVSFDDVELSAGEALEGVTPDEDAETEAEAGEPQIVYVGSKPWGVLPAIMLFPCVIVLFVAGLMGYELMHSVWGYHQPTKPTSVVTDAVAQMFDLKPKE